MIETSKKHKKISDIINSNKTLYYTILGVAMVIFAVLVFKGMIKSENKLQESWTPENYVSTLEEKLENILSEIGGAGKVAVAISVESGRETVIAKEITTSKTENGTEIVEKPVIINGQTVVLKELYPKITGVLIVAEGASNITVMTRMQQAAISLLDININQIEILTMK